MTLMRYRPFSLVNELQSEMNNLLNRNIFGEESPLATGDWVPAIDVLNEKDKLVIKADIPGVEPKDIKIELKDNILSIEGEKSSEEETKDKEYYKFERSYGSFCRHIRLPENVDTDNISAGSDHGVLVVTIPKKTKEQADVRKIEVKTK